MNRYPEPSTAIHSYPQISTAIHSYPQLSTAVHSCPQLSTDVHSSPQLFAAVCSCSCQQPQIFIAISSYLQLTTAIQSHTHRYSQVSGAIWSYQQMFTAIHTYTRYTHLSTTICICSYHPKLSTAAHHCPLLFTAVHSYPQPSTNITTAAHSCPQLCCPQLPHHICLFTGYTQLATALLSTVIIPTGIHIYLQILACPKILSDITSYHQPSQAIPSHPAILSWSYLHG